MSKQIDFNDLLYYFKSKDIASSFIGFRGPLNLYKNIKNGNTSIKKLKKIKNNLNRI